MLATIKQKRPPVSLTGNRFYGDADWKKSVREKIRRHFAGKARRPFAITGAIASSDRLIKDDETLSVWLKIAKAFMLTRPIDPIAKP